MSQVLNDLFDIIQNRKAHPRPGSYTAELFDAGENRILQKLGEEAIEVIIAAKGEGEERIVYELADFVYHSLVLLAERGLDWADVEAELQSRMK